MKTTDKNQAGAAVTTNPPNKAKALAVAGALLMPLLLLGYIFLLIRLGEARRLPAPGVEPWWSDLAAARVGGWGGAAVGVLGGLVGTMAGCGIARRLTLGLMAVASLAGVAATVAGVIALAGGQAYSVWYPLLLSGPIAALVFGGLFPVARMGFAARERQKMAAMDA